ncbi:Uncharacterised protein [Mycobacteroides abscessus subsp. bolletii]|nr:Uncharacterised protein [Mycobacteroides abscessus subsp. bolletii]
MHDGIDRVGQTLPGVGIQSQVRVTDIAGEHLQVLVGQCAEVRQQSGVAGVERFLQAPVRGVGILSANDDDQLAVCFVQALKPFQGQIVAQVTVRAGEQHGLWGSGRPGECGGRTQGGLVDELVQGQVGGADLGVPGTVHRVGGGTCTA